MLTPNSVHKDTYQRLHKARKGSLTATAIDTLQICAMHVGMSRSEAEAACIPLS